MVSPDGLLCCTISDDNSAKVYDVVNYDMMSMLRLSFVPGAIEWVCKQGDAKAKLAISELSTPMVHIFDACAHSNEPSDSKKISSAPIRVMKYNAACDVVVSADAKGLIEYWSPNSLEFPSHCSNSRWTQTSTHLQRPGQLFILLRLALMASNL
jgi:peptidylprolyl isomerase domain and WD repeat-containing protein 1